MSSRCAETTDPTIKTRVISLRPIPDQASMDDWLATGSRLTAIP
jgi:hypothetical protein